MLKFFMTVFVALICTVTSETLHAAKFDVSPQGTPELKASAKWFGAQLDGSAWSMDCGSGAMTFGFDPSGSIALLPAWSTNEWFVVSSRQVRIVEKSGETYSLTFDKDVGEFQFLDFRFVKCIGKRLK